MSEEIKSHHLRALACDIEDCHNPQSWADYCRAAANRIEAQAAEITRLRAELATARRDGMEGMEMQPEFLQWVTREMPSGTEIHNPYWWAQRIWAAAIRAAAREVKP